MRKKGLRISFMALAALTLLTFASCTSNNEYIIPADDTVPPEEIDGENIAEQLNPFEGLSVTFDGISPYCTISLNTSGCSDAVEKYVDFSLSPDSVTTEGNFAAGESVTVYATLREPETGGAAYALSESEKTYLVQDVPEYITEITGDMDLSILKQAANDYLASITAWSVGDYEPMDAPGDFQSKGETVAHDSYFCALKANAYNKFSNEVGYFNKISLTYSIDLEIAAGFWGDELQQKTQYFTIDAKNIIRYPDGSLGWGTQDPATMDFEYQTDSTNLESLINKNIVSLKSDYNVSTVTEILA
ncbi:MAG: hypothetical protein ACLU8W_01530 [Clostridia bacterium]